MRIKNYNHPMCEEVVRILRSISGELSLSGDVLVLGDSTSAYCVDRENEVSWPDLRARSSEACAGVNFYFESWSVATPRAFLSRQLMLLGGVVPMTGFS